MFPTWLLLTVYSYLTFVGRYRSKSRTDYFALSIAKERIETAPGGGSEGTHRRGSWKDEQEHEHDPMEKRIHGSSPIQGTALRRRVGDRTCESCVLGLPAVNHAHDSRWRLFCHILHVHRGKGDQAATTRAGAGGGGGGRRRTNPPTGTCQSWKLASPHNSTTSSSVRKPAKRTQPRGGRCGPNVRSQAGSNVQGPVGGREKRDWRGPRDNANPRKHPHVAAHVVGGDWGSRSSRGLVFVRGQKGYNLARSLNISLLIREEEARH